MNADKLAPSLGSIETSRLKEFDIEGSDVVAGELLVAPVRLVGLPEVCSDEDSSTALNELLSGSADPSGVTVVDDSRDGETEVVGESDVGGTDDSSGDLVPVGCSVVGAVEDGGPLVVGASVSLLDGEVDSLGLFEPVGLLLSSSLWLGVGLADLVGVGRGFGEGTYGVSLSGTTMSGSGA